MREKITQAEVKRLFRYDYEIGDLFWRQRVTSAVKLDKPAGCSTGRGGYRSIQVRGKTYLAHRLVWLYHHGYLPEHGLDHRDRNRQNNRVDNLREVSQTCNTRNSGNYSTNTSGVKGVSRIRWSGKWQVSIKINGKPKHIGHFVEFIDAVKARYKKERELNWSRCDSASPAFQYLEKHGALP